MEEILTLSTTRLAGLVRSGSVSSRDVVEAHVDALHAEVVASLAELDPWFPWCHEGYERTEMAEFVRRARRARERGLEYHFAIQDAADAAGLLRAAMRGSNPTIFFEHRAMLDAAWARRPYPGDDYVIEFGKGRVLTPGGRLLLIVPQDGELLLETELGRLHVQPHEVALVPRGVRFRVRLPEGTTVDSPGVRRELAAAHRWLRLLGVDQLADFLIYFLCRRFAVFLFLENRAAT